MRAKIRADRRLAYNCSNFVTEPKRGYKELIYGKAHFGKFPHPSKDLSYNYIVHCSCVGLETELELRSYILSLSTPPPPPLPPRFPRNFSLIYFY